MIQSMGIHEPISVHGNLLLRVFQCGRSFRVSSKSGEVLKPKKKMDSYYLLILTYFKASMVYKKDLHD